METPVSRDVASCSPVEMLDVLESPDESDKGSRNVGTLLADYLM